MDAVYTYVDGDDPEWKLAHALNTGAEPNDVRHRDHGELLLSVQLLMKNAPWVRLVHVVYATISDRLKSQLASIVGPRLRLVAQMSLVNKPTFSSCVVEAHLWRLPGVSSFFVYLNDDVAIGRPVPRSIFWANAHMPWIDVSALSDRSGPKNLAQQHNENAWREFVAVFPRHALPKVHAAHRPSVMSVVGCRHAWKLFPHVFQNLDPVRTHNTVNTQLLMALVTVQLGIGHMRCRIHAPPHNLAHAFVEDEPEGLAYVLQNRPHFFCINGITEASQQHFAVFSRQYLSERVLCPAIKQWHWTSELLDQEKEGRKPTTHDRVSSV